MTDPTVAPSGGGGTKAGDERLGVEALGDARRVDHLGDRGHERRRTAGEQLGVAPIGCHPGEVVGVEEAVELGRSRSVGAAADDMQPRVRCREPPQLCGVEVIGRGCGVGDERDVDVCDPPVGAQGAHHAHQWRDCRSGGEQHQRCGERCREREVPLGLGRAEQVTGLRSRTRCGESVPSGWAPTVISMVVAPASLGGVSIE